MEKPDKGYCTDVQVLKVVDGDTIRVSYTRVFDVRIKDINAPELNTAEGKEAREFLERLIDTSTFDGIQKITIFVPSNNEIKLMDFNSFGRVVADCWVGKQNIGDCMVEMGHAKESKR